jgi:beta-glucanase (GH16 family)
MIPCRKRSILFPLLVSLCLPTIVFGAAYKLVWADEFETPGLPDPEKWGYDVGGWGWGNSELQYYTADRLENARVEDGYLIIEAHKEPNYLGSGNDYTSARLLTKDKHSWQYGRFEARIKVPDGAGLWPAFWMLGTDIDEVGWPQCGEIDIMEYVGREPNRIFGTIHGPRYSGGGSFGGEYEGFSEPVPENFHTYAVEWEEDSIRWFINDIEYFSSNPEAIRGTGRTPLEWVFNHEFFMIVNLALGGNFGGTLDPELEFPVRMLVDYIRVYEATLGIFDDYPQVDGWVDTGDFLGNVFVEEYPWVYLESRASWFYSPDLTSEGGWLYLPSGS